MIVRDMGECGTCLDVELGGLLGGQLLEALLEQVPRTLQLGPAVPNQIETVET